MNNIDKDIGIVKEIITHKDDYDVCFGYRIAKPYSVSAEEIQAISNVLSEFETLREISGGLVIDNANLKIEAETYKKIAEKLAEEMVLHGICSGVEESDKCYANEIQCGKCIIDWARKEVEKDETHS